MKTIIWTDYIRYRSSTRGYELRKIENVLRDATERYFDNATGRRMAIGKHSGQTVAVPYEESETSITPITIHATNRKQINFRINTGRYIRERY